jgi:hypothetical protein
MDTSRRKLLRRIMLIPLVNLSSSILATDNKGTEPMHYTVTTLSKADSESTYYELTHNAEEFLRHPFLFSWWIHGGEPGPDYVSMAIDFTNKEGRLEAIFVQAKFDFQATPHQYTNKQSGVIAAGTVVNLLRDMLESNLFTTEFPEEKDPKVADILKETWQFNFGRSKLEKTFYEPFPHAVETLRKTCKLLIGQLKTHN